MTFERIVRPFQTVPFTPVAPPAVIEVEELENIVLEFGKEGEIKTLTGSSSASNTSFTKTEHKEVKRETSERRVENPDDPSQYVTVEDTDKVESEAGKKDTYVYMVQEFEKKKSETGT